MPRCQNGKPWWIALFGGYATAMLVVGVLSLTGSDEAVRVGGAHTGGPGPPRPAATQEMIDQHQHMTELMRLDTSPQMIARMDADPMWASMRNEAFNRTLEDEQADIDRMLGRGAP